MIELLRRLWRHISPEWRIQICLLLVVMFLASIAEMVSIGVVIPFLGALTAPEILYEHRLLRPVVSYFGFHEPQDLLLPITLAFVAAVLTAGSIRMLLSWMQAKITAGIVNELAVISYHKTLHQPYVVQISRSSSEIIGGILSKVSGGVGGTFGAVLLVTSSLLILSAIISALLVADPLVAMASFLGFGSAYGLIASLTKKKLAFDSDCINNASTSVVKILQEGLGGIRDVLLDGTQSIYIEAYRQEDANLRKAQASIQFISIAPRFVIEAFGMVIIACIAYGLTSRPGGFMSMIPLVGALAIGAQRVLPLLHQAYSSWVQLQGGRDLLRDALDLLDQPIPQESSAHIFGEAVNFNEKIQLVSASFQYGEHEPDVLRGVTLTLPKGARVGFIGATGSGKSTLVDILMGLLQPTDGYLMVDGKKISAHNRRAWQKHIAHVPQAIFLADASIAENIAFGVPIGNINMSRVRLAARQAQISEVIESWDLQYETSVGERGIKLSGGQRQRIGIARALYKQADVLIFDEATSALDNETEQAVMNTIDNLGSQLTVLLIAHRLTTLRNCSQVIELQDGKINKIGTYAELVGHADNLHQ